MEQSERKQVAAERKRLGTHNCAQAIVCTYADVAGLTDEQARGVGGAFAAGMGNMEGTCGALVGAGIVLGRALPDKGAAMMAMRRVMDRFAARNGATQCRRLKGVGTGTPLRQCPDCVADAAELLDDELRQHGARHEG